MDTSETQHGDGEKTKKAAAGSKLCYFNFQFTKEEVFKEVKKIMLLAWPTVSQCLYSNHCYNALSLELSLLDIALCYTEIFVSTINGQFCKRQQYI